MRQRVSARTQLKGKELETRQLRSPWSPSLQTAASENGADPFARLEEIARFGHRMESFLPGREAPGSAQPTVQRMMGGGEEDVLPGRTQPTLVLPSPSKPVPLEFPEDSRVKERREMEEESRRAYQKALVETGAPPKWDLYMKDPKFARAVHSEDERIRREASLERTERLAREANLQRGIEEEYARTGGVPARTKKKVLGLPLKASNTLLKFLDPQSLLNLRTTNRQNRDAVRDYHQAQTPYPDKVSFASATTGHFPKSFSKGEYTKDEIGMHENMSLAWEEYNKSVSYRETYPQWRRPSAFVERMDDNRFQFQQNMNRDQREGLEQTGRLFAPSRGRWTPQMNDAWLLGLLHSKAPINLVSRPESSALYEREEQRPTQTGRELLLARRSGWQVGTPQTGVDEPFQSGGITLNPPPHPVPARIQDAETPDGKEELRDFSYEHSGSFREPVVHPDWRSPEFEARTKEQINEDYRQQQIGGVQGKLKTIFNKYNLLQGAKNTLSNKGKRNKWPQAAEDKEKYEEQIKQELEDLNRIIKKFMKPEDMDLLEQWIEEAINRLKLKKTPDLDDLLNRISRH